ncbi:hypothetical protein QUB30_12730 [Microcoleus sp. BROC3]
MVEKPGFFPDSRASRTVIRAIACLPAPPCRYLKKPSSVNPDKYDILSSNTYRTFTKKSKSPMRCLDLWGRSGNQDS